MTASAPVDFRRNSIDVVRICAAGQVAFYHLWSHIPGLSHDFWFLRFLAYFPGVPIFFFISGFVITAAWIRDPDVLRYAVSRLFRILPALYACIVFSAISILLLYGRQVSAHAPSFGMWLVAQFGLVTSWNPAFLRGFGVGVVNGSLWTIPVELLFYLAALPMLAIERDRRLRSIVLIWVAVVSLVGNVVAHYAMPRLGLPPMATKVATLSPLSFTVWIWMFCVGGLASLWYQKIVPILVDWFWVIVLAFIVLSVASTFIEVPGILRPFGNNTGLLNMLALSAMVLGFAFRYPDCGHQVLRGNDISYGLYLFHMPLLNIALQLGLRGLICFIVAFLGGIAVATACWFAIERPMIALSKYFRRRMTEPKNQLTIG